MGGATREATDFLFSGSLPATAQQLETWKAIPGYEGFYEVSDCGRVKSLARTGKRQDAILFSRPTAKGYLRVSLSRPGEGKTSHYIHRLVLLAFLDRDSVNRETRHLNGVPSDNRLENLRWGTSAENHLDSMQHGTILSGTRCPWAKLTESNVTAIRNSPRIGVKEWAVRLGVGMSIISKIRHYRKWKHLA